MLMSLPNISSGALADADVVARAICDIFWTPSSPTSSGIVSAICGSLAVGALQVRADEEIEELVGATELDVGLDRDRVVALQQRVHELDHRDRAVAP